MWFFNKESNTQKESVSETRPTLDLSTTTRDRLEIQLSKNASAEEKQKAHVINAHVKELLEGNGFHVKLYIAAGGTPKGGHK